MRIRDLILPEDTVFFTLFREMTGKITEASTVLNEITHELPGGTETAQGRRPCEGHDRSFNVDELEGFVWLDRCTALL